MPRVPDAIAALLTREVESRRTWDEMPELYGVRLSAAAVSLWPMGVPEALWAAGRTPEVLGYLADTIGALMRRYRLSVPEGLYGVAVRSEGWTLATEERSPEAERAARAHRLADLPGAVECRFMVAVDRAGITYDAELRRGCRAAAARVVFPSAAGSGRSVGSVPDALDAILSAMLGVTLPPRPPEG